MLSMLAQLIAVTGSLSTPVALPTSCEMSSRPQVVVQRFDRGTRYNTSKSARELNTISRGTVSPYGVNVDQTTAGLRDNKPEIVYDIRYQLQTDPVSKTACMSLKNINMKIILKPLIYIAKEYSAGECGRQVMGHEQKHVYVDQKIVDEYVIKMDRALQKKVSSMSVQGPFPKDQSEAIKMNMQAQVSEVVERIKNEMVVEINTRQQEIDSLEEYKRVGRYCEKQSTRKSNWR